MDSGVWCSPISIRTCPPVGCTCWYVRGVIGRSCLRILVPVCSVAISSHCSPRKRGPRALEWCDFANFQLPSQETPMPSKSASAIEGPKIKTALPGPNARRVLEGDERYISPSYTRSYPLVAKSGRGIVVTDVDGNEFFDFSAGIAVTSTGHCHPDVVAAIQKQAAQLIHMSGTDFYYENMVELAARLSKIAPMAGPHRIYYGNSGAEAIECALKLARYHTKRHNVIAFFGAFHGRTMGALSLTASKPQQRRRFSPLVPGVTHVRYPDGYRGCDCGAQEADN